MNCFGYPGKRANPLVAVQTELSWFILAAGFDIDVTCNDEAGTASRKIGVEAARAPGLPRQPLLPSSPMSPLGSTCS
jgi:hypothetical protein